MVKLLQRLGIIHAAKLELLATARAEKARIDAKCKRLEDVVETYRKAIDAERKANLKCAAKKAARKRRREATSSDSEERVARPQPQLAITNGVVAGQPALQQEDTKGWEPEDATWQEMAMLWRTCRGASRPDGAVCAGTLLNGNSCKHTNNLYRVNVETLKNWPVKWGRHKVRIAPYPLLCKSCDKRIRGL